MTEQRHFCQSDEKEGTKATRERTEQKFLAGDFASFELKRSPEMRGLFVLRLFSTAPKSFDRTRWRRKLYHASPSRDSSQAVVSFSSRNFHCQAFDKKSQFSYHHFSKLPHTSRDYCTGAPLLSLPWRRVRLWRGAFNTI